MIYKAKISKKTMLSFLVLCFKEQYLPISKIKYSNLEVKLDNRFITNHDIIDTEFVSFDSKKIKLVIYKTKLQTQNKNKFYFFSHGNDCARNCLNSAFVNSESLKDVNVCVWDYRECFGSEGEFTKESTNKDLDAALHFLRNEYTMEQCVLIGHSFGTGVTTEYLKYVKNNKKEILFNGVVLISPYSSVISISSEIFIFKMLKNIPRLLNKIKKLYAYDNLENISFIDCKILLIHGIQDKTIPIDHSYKLEKELAVKNKNYDFIKKEEYNHDDIYLKEDIWEAIRNFK